VKFPKEDHSIPSNEGCADSLGLFMALISGVTCRWHVLLDVSGIGTVASLSKVSVLTVYPEPLLT
jgi:hypothetical protein